jgi:hypothetical protein
MGLENRPPRLRRCYLCTSNDMYYQVRSYGRGDEGMESYRLSEQHLSSEHESSRLVVSSHRLPKMSSPIPS